MLVLSSLLMRSSGGGDCLATVYRRRVGPAAGRTGGSPAAALEVGAHALEDLEVVVRERAAVEVLEHVAAAVLAEPPPLLRWGGGQLLRRRRRGPRRWTARRRCRSPPRRSIARASPSNPSRIGRSMAASSKNLLGRIVPKRSSLRKCTRQASLLARYAGSSVRGTRPVKTTFVRPSARAASSSSARCAPSPMRRKAMSSRPMCLSRLAASSTTPRSLAMPMVPAKVTTNVSGEKPSRARSSASGARGSNRSTSTPLVTTLILDGADALADHVHAVAVADGDDVVGAVVERLLELAERLDDASVRQGADGDDGVRPDVADLEHERRAVGARDRPARPAGEELRAGGDDDVGARPDERAGRAGRGQVREVVEAAAHAPLVGREPGPDADRADAVDPLLLVQLVLVALVDHAGGDVGRAGQHRDTVPAARPLPRHAVHARGRGVVLGREVVGQEQDVHAARASVTRPRRPGRSTAPSGAWCARAPGSPPRRPRRSRRACT